MAGLREFFRFLIENSQYWLSAAVIQTALFGLMLLAQDYSGIGPLPFIYSIF
jgi:Family of unknown function (DUF5989)